VREAVDGLVQSIATLQETGRRWSGQPPPTPADLAAAAGAAEQWDLLHPPASSEPVQSTRPVT